MKAKVLPLFVSLFIILVLLFSEDSFSAPRKVLTEMFTSTTCAPCYNADNYFFHTWLPNYGGADQIVVIAYHVWWPTPGNDPMYLANPTPVQTRNTYYQPSGAYAPRMFIDGFIDGGSGYTSWPGAIEPRFLDPSPVTITLSGTRNGNTLDLTATIFAEVAVNSTNWRVHWVAGEDGINEPQNSGSGYVPFIHNWVHRSMYPDANGSPITISQGQTVQIQRTITLSSNWVANNSKVIVFVQNNADKKVQQAEVINVNTILAVKERPGVPDKFALTQNYPNPFNPTTTIDFALKEQTHVTMTVFNLLGEEVRTLVDEVRGPGYYSVEWDGKNAVNRELGSGMYLYKIKTGNYTETRKMILLR